MKTNDILKQLQARLPLFNDDFTKSFDITGMVKSGDDIEISPNITGMVADSYITIKGLRFYNDVSSFSVDSGVATITTNKNNQVNINFLNRATLFNGSENVYLEVIDIVDSKTFKVNTAITDFTGYKLVENIPNYNKQYKIKEVKASSFVIENTSTVNLEFDYSEAKVNYSYNIYGVGFTDAIDRYIESNTEVVGDVKVPKTSAEPSLWVSMLDDNTSQSRTTFDDAVHSATQGQDNHLQLVKTFEIVLTYPVNNDVTGFTGLNYAEDLAPQLNKCLFGLILPNYTQTNSKYVLNPISNSPIQSNGAIYQHQYVYEGMYEIQNTTQGTIVTDVDGNEVISGNDGVDIDTFNFSDIELQYKLQYDDFKEVKRTQEFDLQP